ncbi:MAG: uracil-DNA glycosylase [Candidatus Caenarcaniphilales bacterium]|nr:uracil-DNA glycosylase [Candidatus Caenarcaniphilales bacterium]
MAEVFEQKLFTEPSGSIKIPKSSPADGQITWPKLEETFSSHDEMDLIVKKCQKCPLGETKTNGVVYDGNPQAKLMLIGEGPGEQEDLQGLPFVGRAGQLLDKILEAANIDRKTETYICNIVKCRPPNNRVPAQFEAEQCIGYLKYQIDYVKPKIILLLGSTALTGVLKMKNPKITKLHGSWIDGEGELLQGIKIMPFYHPSYLLRNPSKNVGGPKWQAWQAIKEVRKELDSL